MEEVIHETRVFLSDEGGMDVFLPWLRWMIGKGIKVIDKKHDEVIPECFYPFLNKMKMEVY